MAIKCLLMVFIPLGCADMCLGNPVGVSTGSSCICGPAESPQVPRPFYELIPGFGYYKLHTNGKSWHDAKQICESEGAHLAIINSIAEARILDELRRRLPKLHGSWEDDSILIGISDIQEEGVWKTIFNDPLTSMGFRSWDINQPSKGVNGNCGLYRPSTAKLHDIDCTQILPFYCELEI